MAQGGHSGEVRLQQGILDSGGPSGKSAFANRLDIGLIRQNITNSTVVTLPDNLQGYYIK